MTIRLAVFASHPIQYQVPVWRAIVATGVDVTVFFFSDHGVSGSLDPDFGTNVVWDIDLLSGYQHELLPSITATRAGSRLAGMHPGVAAAIRRSRFDAVLVSGYATAGYAIAILTALARRIPLYIRAETLDDVSAARSAKLSRTLTSMVVRRMAGAFPIGEASEKWYLERGADAARLVRIGYGIDNERFQRPHAEDALKFRRQRFQADHTSVVLLFAGKFIDRKQPLFVASVARLLRDEGERVRVVYAGGGPLEPSLRSALGPEDVLLGFVNQGEMPLLYAAADITLVPSTYETWGLVVNESLASGTPVIASGRVPGGVELSTRTDAVVVPGSMTAEEWADAVRGVMSMDRQLVSRKACVAITEYDAVHAGMAIGRRILDDLA